MNSRANGRNRRRHERSPINISLTVLWGDGHGQENFASAKLVDLSKNGARFRLPVQIPRGAWLTFNCVPLGVGGRGTVRHCRLSKGMYEIGVEIPNGTGWKHPADSAREERETVQAE